MSWDAEVDFLVVGSGAGGMTAAVVAAVRGADVLVLEKTGYFGGTTALSGGVVWMPNNADMKRGGLSDSESDAVTYLKQVVGPDVAESKLRAYVREGNKMLAFMEANADLRFEAALRYADYYPDLEGGKTGGRSMEPQPTSRRKLGKLSPTLRYPDYLSGFMRFAVTVKESRELMDLTLKGKWIMLRNMLVYYLDLPSRIKKMPDNRMTLGRALVVRLRLALERLGVNVQLNTAAKELVFENGRVTGLVVEQDGQRRRIRARKGVLLAAGGMGQNVALRQQYGQLPTGETFSSDSPGNVGDAIVMGKAIGAALEFMPCAWWTPAVKLPDGEIQALISGKSMPGSIFVDGTAKRFCNEAAPYEDVVKALWDNHARGNDSVPSYMVFDARARREYMMGPLVPGKVQPDAVLPKSYFESGFLNRGDSWQALAEQIGVPAEQLEKTIEQHNRFAETGRDEDYGRGDSATDRYYSDPKITPNPNLAPMVEPPFYAIPVYPGDLGTKGGLKFDEQARVIDEAGQVIDGLYVTGNCAGSVMGNSYPGAGSTIGPSMTFGYVAAMHATQE